MKGPPARCPSCCRLPICLLPAHHWAGGELAALSRLMRSGPPCCWAVAQACGCHAEEGHRGHRLMTQVTFSSHTRLQGAGEAGANIAHQQNQTQGLPGEDARLPSGDDKGQARTFLLMCSRRDLTILGK